MAVTGWELWSTLLAVHLLISVLGGLMGFRTVAGRDGRIRKRALYRAAVLRGVSAAQWALLLLLGLGLGLSLVSPLGAQLLWPVARGLRAAVRIYLGYALVVGCTFVPFSLPSTEVRSLVVVAVFGPLSLIQPWVVVGGMVAMVWAAPRWEVALLALAGALVALGLEPWLVRRTPRGRATVSWDGGRD